MSLRFYSSTENTYLTQPQ